jgi:hypothetical protein
MSINNADSFPLTMLSAMYENGGNTTQRILDGHPELFVYPFESQIGTRFVNDRWAALYPVKYRWPVFALDASVGDHYDTIIDEEAKVRSRTPFVSKFRDHAFELDDDERKRRFEALMEGTPKGTATLMAAFFTATFDVWHNLARSGREHVWVGYSPVFGIDADRFLSDMPRGHLLHIVRNPWSAYAETRRRPVPLSLAHYVEAWTVLQTVVLAAQETWGERITVVRFEDLCEDPRAALQPFCRRVGIEPASLQPAPSWNGRRLTEVYPWGTIRVATPEANTRTAAELDDAERAEVTRRARSMLEPLGYTDFLAQAAAVAR